MKWPKSEKKIDIGGGGELEKLGGPPDGVPPSQKSGCATVQTKQYSIGITIPPIEM